MLYLQRGQVAQAVEHPFSKCGQLVVRQVQHHQHTQPIEGTRGEGLQEVVGQVQGMQLCQVGKGRGLQAAHFVVWQIERDGMWWQVRHCQGRRLQEALDAAEVQRCLDILNAVAKAIRVHHRHQCHCHQQQQPEWTAVGGAHPGAGPGGDREGQGLGHRDHCAKDDSVTPSQYNQVLPTVTSAAHHNPAPFTITQWPSAPTTSITQCITAALLPAKASAELVWHMELRIWGQELCVRWGVLGKGMQGFADRRGVGDRTNVGLGTRTGTEPYRIPLFSPLTMPSPLSPSSSAAFSFLGWKREVVVSLHVTTDVGGGNCCHILEERQRHLSPVAMPPPWCSVLWLHAPHVLISLMSLMSPCLQVSMTSYVPCVPQVPMFCCPP